MNNVRKYRLAPGWRECVSTSIPGRVFFYNTNTKCSMWSPPLIRDDKEFTNSSRDISIENAVSGNNCNDPNHSNNNGVINEDVPVCEFSTFNSQSICNLVQNTFKEINNPTPVDCVFLNTVGEFNDFDCGDESVCLIEHDCIPFDSVQLDIFSEYVAFKNDYFNTLEKNECNSSDKICEVSKMNHVIETDNDLNLRNLAEIPNTEVKSNENNCFIQLDENRPILQNVVEIIQNDHLYAKNTVLSYGPMYPHDEIEHTTKNNNFTDDESIKPSVTIPKIQTENNNLSHEIFGHLEDSVNSLIPSSKNIEISVETCGTPYVMNNFNRKISWDKWKKINLIESSSIYAENIIRNDTEILKSNKRKRDKFKNYDTSSTSSDESISLRDELVESKKKYSKSCSKNNFKSSEISSVEKKGFQESADGVYIFYDDKDNASSNLTEPNAENELSSFQKKNLNRMKKHSSWEWNRRSFVNDYAEEFAKNDGMNKMFINQKNLDTSQENKFSQWNSDCTANCNVELTRKNCETFSDSKNKFVNLMKKTDSNLEVISDDIQITRIFKDSNENSKNVNYSNTVNENSVNLNYSDTVCDTVANEHNSKLFGHESMKQTTKEVFDIPKQHIILVLDTNILLKHLRFVNFLLNFAIPELGLLMIVIPYVVVEDLNNKKLPGSSVSSEARLALLFLDIHHPRLFQEKQVNLVNNCEEIDDHVLQFCIQYKELMKMVILLTDNFNLRIKAKACNMESYTKQDFCARYLWNSVEENIGQVTKNLSPCIERKIMNSIINELKISLKICLKQIIETGIEHHYGKNWEDRIHYNDSWNLLDLFSCLKFYWTSLFNNEPSSFARKCLNSINKFFIGEFDYSEYSLNEVNDIIENCINLSKDFSRQYLFATRPLRRNLNEMKNWACTNTFKAQQK